MTADCVLLGKKRKVRELVGSLPAFEPNRPPHLSCQDQKAADEKFQDSSCLLFQRPMMT
jgi:hypothetical protein